MQKDINEELQPLVGVRDLPPAYTPSPTTPTFSGSNVTLSSDAPVINCRVCHTLLHVEGKLHLHVIKCHACGEATPIRPAPPMKKYVRCPCNCLLICKVTSQRVVCPRVNCKRVISLMPVLSNVNLSDEQSERSAFNVRVICTHCNFSFIPVRSLKKIQQCPHCNTKSFSSPFYRRRILRFCSFLISFLFIVIVIAIALLFAMFKKSIALYVFISIISLLFVVLLIALIYASLVRSSRIEQLPFLQYS